MNKMISIATLLQGVTALILLFGLLLKSAKTLNKFLNRKTSFKELKSTFTDYDIMKATQIFIPTRGQEFVVSKEKNLELKKFKLIPYLNKRLNSICIEKFYLILASAGMGKTTFMINLFIKYNRRIFKKYKMKLLALNSRDVDIKIESIEDKRNTILLLDGFDEDQQAINNSKTRIQSLIEKGKEFQAVVITSRLQFFSSEADEPTSIDIGEYFSKLDGGEHRLHKLHISGFNKDDVNDFLRKKYPFYQRSKRKKAELIIWRFIDILTAPMLLRYIDVFVNEVEERVFSFTHEIYEGLINHWISRKSKRIQNELKQFSRALAVDMYMNRNKRNGLYIDGSELKSFAIKLGLELTEDEMKSRSLLTRNVEGQYMFYHKSFLEYFLADELMKNKKFNKSFEFDGMDQTYIFYQEFYEKKYNKKLAFDEGYYDCLTNSKDEILIAIKKRIGEPIDPKIVYDGGLHAIFYRNPGFIIRLDYLNPDIRPRIQKVKKILMVEFLKDELSLEYEVPILIVPELPDFVPLNSDRLDLKKNK